MAVGASKTYNLAQVSISINGVPIEGFGESDAISFEPNSDLYESAVGADGEVTRSATNDRSGTITITLMSTSLSNLKFSGFMALSKALGAADKFIISVNDTNSGDFFLATNAYIQKEPNSTYARNASEREWTLYAANVTTAFTGNLS